MTKPIPDGYHTITAMCCYKDTRKAIDFYKRAFGAEERSVMPGANGKGIVHAEIKIGDSIFMMGDEKTPSCKSAESFGGSPTSFYLYVKDADAAFKKAIEAGAKSEMAMEDMFWGDRMGTVKDPFGYSWSFATHKKDLSPQEIQKGAEAFFAHKATR